MGPSIQPSDVCVVTVTYGDRAHLCLAVAEAVLRLGIRRLVIVSNGSTAGSFEALEAFASLRPKTVELVRLPNNVGSAGGFATGLRQAEQTTHSYIWLLDDDNVPLDDTLTKLLESYSSLTDSQAPHDIVVFAARPDRMAALLHGVPVSRAYPSRGGFAGFNIIEIPRKLAIKGFTRFRNRRSVVQPIEIPFGPYGGMLLPRSVIRRAGYPDARLVLYEDDTDYTRRLHEAGAKLFVVPNASIRDIDTSWYTRSGGRTQFGRVLSAPSEARVYFYSRNRVYFETHRWSGPRWLFLINKFIYIAALWALARSTGRGDRFRLVLEAARHGESQDFRHIRLTPDGEQLIRKADGTA